MWTPWTGRLIHPLVMIEPERCCPPGLRRDYPSLDRQREEHSRSTLDNGYRETASRIGREDLARENINDGKRGLVSSLLRRYVQGDSG